MTSTIIHGMEMPKSCFFCRFQNLSYCHAVYNNPGEAQLIPDENLIKNRPEWCPLEEIKEES